MTIDTLDEFPTMSFEEALMSAGNRPEWLINGIIGPSSTLLYGEANVGKSFLVSALIASLVTGDPFLEAPVPEDREFSVALCWTDDAGPDEYGKRIREVVPEGTTPNVTFYEMPVMRTRDMWSRLHQKIVLAGHNMVIIDNLTQCLNGSINQDEVVREFFDGVRMFTREGFPVVIVGHSSDKAGMNGYKSDKPMGSAGISQSVRWQVFASRSRKGNMKLKFRGNLADAYEMTIKHNGPSARFQVVGVQTPESDADQVRTRSVDTLDRNAEQARWVVEHCQGTSRNRTAAALAEAFGGSTESYRAWLKPGSKLGALVRQSGDRWELAP